MSTKKMGGNAFPVPGDCPWDKTLEQPSFGMTLWDYYAAAALSGIIANPEGPAGVAEMCAADAAKQADAMLAERERRVKP